MSARKKLTGNPGVFPCQVYRMLPLFSHRAPRLAGSKAQCGLPTNMKFDQLELIPMSSVQLAHGQDGAFPCFPIPSIPIWFFTHVLKIPWILTNARNRISSYEQIWRGRIDRLEFAEFVQLGL